MARADHSYGFACEMLTRLDMRHGSGKYPLGYRRRVASRRVSYSDTSAAAITEVNMVGADRGGTYETAAAAVEERCIAASACACQQYVGIAHHTGINLAAGKSYNLSET